MPPFFFFFFSSRRRHTRFSRDWSSDVCSSDLFAVVWNPGAECAGVRRSGSSTTRVLVLVEARRRRRSEERRVGKSVDFGARRDTKQEQKKVAKQAKHSKQINQSVSGLA